MEFDRKIFVNKLDNILGLIRTLETAYQEKSDKLSVEDVNELVEILETKLIDVINYAKID